MVIHHKWNERFSETANGDYKKYRPSKKEHAAY